MKVNLTDATSFDELTLSYTKKHMNINSPLESGGNTNEKFKNHKLLSKTGHFCEQYKVHIFK